MERNRAAAFLTRALCGALTLATASCASPPPDQRWVASCGTSLYDPGPATADYLPTAESLGGATVRNVLTPTAAGDRARVTFSNRYGETPLFIGSATIGRRRPQDAAVAAVRKLTFSGETSAMVAPGGEIVSDPVSFRVEAGTPLAISLYLAEPVAPPTSHATAWQTSWIVRHGDVASKERPEARAERTGAWHFVNGLDVAARAETPAVVALGDSITEGYGTTVDADRRWTDFLARRLGGAAAVINAGINGNLLLSDSPCFGRSPMTRWRDDVAGRTGAAAVILLAGANDLIQPEVDAPEDPCRSRKRVTAAEMTAGFAALAEKARADGLRIVAGTILPFGNTLEWSPDVEAVRSEVNVWIRESGVFDAVADFDAALADLADPTKLAARFDSGDGLHPNDAGAEAMAMAVDLSVFRNGNE
jgi:lysophospholipase L1-like esterase